MDRTFLAGQRAAQRDVDALRLVVRCANFDVAGQLALLAMSAVESRRLASVARGYGSWRAVLPDLRPDRLQQHRHPERGFDNLVRRMRRGELRRGHLVAFDRGTDVNQHAARRSGQQVPRTRSPGDQQQTERGETRRELGGNWQP